MDGGFYPAIEPAMHWNGRVTILCGVEGACRNVKHQDAHLRHLAQQDAELLEATASEPLNLQEEYAMQQTWLHDEHSACVGVRNNRQHIMLCS